MTDELKPVRCGCGGEAVVHEQEYGEYEVYCPRCFITTDDYDSEAKAIEAWNKRMCADHFREVTKMMDATDIRVGDKDLISRQDAIDAVHYYIESGYKCDIFQELKNLPSAEPERNKGKWIVTSEFEDCRYVKCNQCKVTQVFYYNKPLTNFCPNCGSEMMRGE